MLLVVGVSLVSVMHTVQERGGITLAQAVLHHIDDESHHLREAGTVTAERLDTVFERFGARLVGELGQVNFAAECLMRTRNGVHLVMPPLPTKDALLLMTGRRLYHYHATMTRKSDVLNTLMPEELAEMLPYPSLPPLNALPEAPAPGFFRGRWRALPPWERHPRPCENGRS